MKKRIAILGFLMIISLFTQVVDMSERTSAQTLLSDDVPQLYDAPVPDDYEFEVLAANHTVIGLWPSPGDNFDLEVYTDTTFSTMIDSSTVAGSRVDFVFLNGTEWASPPNRTARVTTGSTSYVIEMENDIPAINLSYPYNGSIDAAPGANEVMDAYELVGLAPGMVYTIHLEVSVLLDLDMFVLNATGGRSDAIAFSTNAGSGVNESTSFTANSTDDIVLVITNENNGTGSYSIIPNLAPTVNVSADQTIFEGQSVQVSGNFSDPDMNDEFTYVWDFGDGTIVSGTVNSTGNLLTNGDFSDGLAGWNVSVEAPGTTTLQVIPQDGTHFNVLEINNPVSDNEGDWDWVYQDLNLNVTNYTSLFLEMDGKAIYQSLSDDGWAGGEYPVHLSIRYMDVNGLWHNGQWTDNPWQHGFFYAGTGEYTYSQKVDQNVWFHFKSEDLMEISPKPMVIERVKVGSSGWAYHGMIDNVEFYGFGSNMTTLFANHTYGDNGIFDVTLTVTDSDGASSSDTLVVTVDNIEPAVDQPASVIIDEGDLASFMAHSTDPGSDDLTFTWNWGHPGIANTVVTNLSNPPNPDPFPSTDINPRDVRDMGSQAYGDDGMFTVTLTVNDDDGDSNVTTASVAVNNLAPYGNLSGPDTGYANQPIGFSANGTDPGSDDLNFTWDWGDGTSDTVNMHFNDGIGPDPDPSPTGVFPFAVMDSAQHSYATKGAYTVTLTIMDDDGGSVSYNMTVNISSAPPVISNVQATPNPQSVGGMVTISAEVTDTDTDIDDITVTVLLTGPDGNSLGNHTMSCDGSGVCTYESNFAAEGDYGFVIWAMDDDDNWDFASGSFSMETQPEEPVESNWKPIIALVFAIVLLLLGILFSHQKPLRFKGILRTDRQYTFLACSMPFVIAEVITCLVSLFTDLLPVPPWFGFAMILDLTILIIGIIVCIVVLVKGKKPETYVQASISEPSVPPPPSMP